ncbi:MAG TPA: hypothetical protein VKU02_06670 [Gemmataceae bacterium]|nr:hypothetical protein [Gemmataceae bacterium]
MRCRSRSVRILINLCFLGLGLGCGPEPPRRPDPNQQAKAKVAALKRLADALAQDPNGAEARGALEDFRNTPLDAEKHPKQVEEMVEFYRQRIQGKYRGFVAQETQREMAPLLARNKPGK